MTFSLIVPGLPGDKTTAKALDELRALIFPGTDNYQVPNNVAIYTDSAAIPVKQQTSLLNKAGVCAMTLAQPIDVAQDGLIIRIASMTAQAHTITTAAAGINGNKNTLTFGGAIGDCVTLQAKGAVWYVIAATNQTLGGA